VPQPQLQELLEAGVHFGHQTRRWNPKMRRFIFAERSGIYIIDLQKTMRQLEFAQELLRNVVLKGDGVLFVCTKKQLKGILEAEAKRCSAFYVTERWLGGTLTNFQTIESRIDYLIRLEDRRDRGELAVLTKKEAGKILEEIERMNRYFGGIKNMKRLPGALFIIDPPMERIAVTEALRIGIPIIAMCDTNCNPDEIDHPIPSNDDAIRAVKLIASRIADAAIEGRSLGQTYAAEVDAGEVDMEAIAAGTYSASPDDPEPMAAAEAAPTAPEA